MCFSTAAEKFGKSHRLGLIRIPTYFLFGSNWCILFSYSSWLLINLPSSHLIAGKPALLQACYSAVSDFLPVCFSAGAGRKACSKGTECTQGECSMCLHPFWARVRVEVDCLFYSGFLTSGSEFSFSPEKCFSVYLDSRVKFSLYVTSSTTFEFLVRWKFLRFLMTFFPHSFPFNVLL